MKKIAAILSAALLLTPMFSSCENGQDDLLTHKYNYDLSEYIDLADYKGIDAYGYAFNVTDEDMEHQILTTRAYYSRSTVITDRGAEEGDIVYINYVTTVDGEEIAGGSETDYELTIGSGIFIDEFENSLIGTKAGDHVSVDGTFPDPYPSYPDYAGEDVHFEIDVTEVRSQELPDYTEDFVRAYLGYDSTADFEADLKLKLEDHYNDIYYEYVSEQVWKVISANTTVKKYPEAEVQSMYDDMVTSNSSYAEAQGINFNDYCNINFGLTEEEFYDYCRNLAEQRIKDEMICYAIARAENITLTDEEYTTRATEYALQYYGLDSLEQFEQCYAKETIRQTLMFDKVHELTVDCANVKIVDE